MINGGSKRKLKCWILKLFLERCCTAQPNSTVHMRGHLLIWNLSNSLDHTKPEQEQTKKGFRHLITQHTIRLHHHSPIHQRILSCKPVQTAKPLYKSNRAPRNLSSRFSNCIPGLLNKEQTIHSRSPDHPITLIYFRQKWTIKIILLGPNPIPDHWKNGQ